MLQREKSPAFQASSPNKLRAGPRDRPLFLPCGTRPTGRAVVASYVRGSATIRRASKMADEEKQPTRLQVATMRPEDSGRGLARLPRRIMEQLALAEGDVVEIAGKRATPARAVAPYSEDEGLDIIRLDGLQRANAEI